MVKQKITNNQRMYDNCTLKRDDIVEIDWNAAIVCWDSKILPGINEPLQFCCRVKPFMLMIKDCKGNLEFFDASLVTKK